ncbi:MAG: hypothetical protein KAX93_05045 [Flavobacterium sp.]|nr:hypothetical protein [Flavobacterium sp.]
MIKSLKAKVFSINTIVGSIISLIAAYFLFPSNFEMAIYPIQTSEYLWASLDPSWVSGLNYISIKNLIWGKDFVFTLGPLSYLTTRVGWGHEKIGFILFDLFCFLNFFIVFLTTYLKSKNKRVTAILILAIAIVLPPYLGSLYAFVLLSFLLFWIKESLEGRNHLAYFFQTIILVLLFYIKFNTGLISFVLFFSAIAYKLIFKKDKPLFLMGYGLLPLILIYFTAIPLHVDIPNYIKYATYIVSGYNDIMYLERSFGDRHLFAIIGLLIPTGILFNKIVKDGKANLTRNIFILFLFSVSGYVLFKQSFVRADEGHMREFYYCILLMVFCITDFHLTLKNKYKYGMLFTLIVIPLYFVNKMDPNAFAVKEKTSKTNYVDGLQNFTSTSGFKLFPNNNQLPENIKKVIDNHTIDIYPWNTQLLLENNLNFTPRPIFQSYTVYTPELEEKNFEHYNSDKAPRFMLYDFGSIDDRYPLFDEPKLNLLLTSNYTCKDTLVLNNRLNLLLEKTKDKKIKLVQTKEYAMYMDSPLIPKEGVYYKVFLYRNVLGDFVSLVNHAPEISLAVVTNDGNSRHYKTSKGLLESGLFGTQHITTTQDFKDYMVKQYNEQRKIVAYYFKPKTASLFKDKIRVKEYKVDVE